MKITKRTEYDTITMIPTIVYEIRVSPETLQDAKIADDGYFDRDTQTMMRIIDEKADPGKDAPLIDRMTYRLRKAGLRIYATRTPTNLYHRGGERFSWQCRIRKESIDNGIDEAIDNMVKAICRECTSFRQTVAGYTYHPSSEFGLLSVTLTDESNGQWLVVRGAPIPSYYSLELI